MKLPMDWDWKRPDYAPIYAERVERLTRIREPGFDLGALKAHYAEHPTQFITDWMCTFDPRNVERGIEATVPFILFPKQSEFIDWLLARWRNRESALAEKSRDAGVSWLCVAFGLWMWLFHPGVVIGFGSRKEIYVDDLGNPASLFWKFREAVNLLPPEFRPAGWDHRKHAPFMRISNPENGSVIVGEAGDNLGRGNRTSIYFVDEAAFLERPDVVDAALSQTTNCRIDVSTPNGEGNSFARKRRAGKIPVFTFSWKDDPRKDQAWYDRQVQLLDPVVLAQEVDISYAASTANAYVPASSVITAMAYGPADVPKTGPWRLGVDVARFGDDKTAIVLRGHRSAPAIGTWGKLKTTEVSGLVRDYCVRCAQAGIKIEQIAVDVIGIGAGVVDQLQDMEQLAHIQIVGVNSSVRLDDGEHYNVRSRMWHHMKDWLDPLNGPVALVNDRELEVDLTALRYTFKGGVLLMESKDDAKKRGIKSPDRADALALTFAEPVRPRVSTPKPEQQWAPFDVTAGY